MRKLSMLVILTGVVILVIGINYSWSQSKKNAPSDENYVQAWFNEVDTNGDGKISRDEHMKHAEKRAEDRFTQMDTNKDGFISKDEFQKGMPKKRKKGKQ
jgi:Ca2+-binding EF-hand superfamily protein